MDPEVDTMLIKILVVGEPAVGKTSLARRYSKGTFTNHYKSTIGVDFLSKHVKWNDKLELHLQLWDLAGQDKIGLQFRTYFKGTLGAICLYDVTQEETKAETLNWKDMLMENCLRHDNTQSYPPVLLIANKIDLLSEEQVPSEAEINRQAINMGFIGGVLTSAKTNIGIDGAMSTLIMEILERQENPMRYIVKDQPKDKDIVQLNPWSDANVRKQIKENQTIIEKEAQKGGNCCY